MLTFKIFRNEKELNKVSDRGEFVEFLYEHLDRFRDNKIAINRAIDYAFSDSEGKGGFLLSAYYQDKLVGELLMISTGMKAFIPENILVYVAVDSHYRGKGFGKAIIKESSKHCTGDIKLHVEYDNPAKRLYERIGFETKYAEMRYIRSQ